MDDALVKRVTKSIKEMNICPGAWFDGTNYYFGFEDGGDQTFIVNRNDKTIHLIPDVQFDLMYDNITIDKNEISPEQLEKELKELFKEELS